MHAPGEVWLDSIKVVGNQSIPEDDLVPGLAIDRARKDGQRVDPYQLGLDTKRIRGAYTRLGFFEAKVDSRIDRQDNAETVVFTIVEGPRSKARVFYSVTSSEAEAVVTGLQETLPEDYILGKLELQTDAPFDYELYEEGKDAIKAMIEDAGYPYVDLEESIVTVDRKEHVAAVSYRVVLFGPRATFGKVTIAGLDEFPALADAVRGRLQFAEGELYSPQALADTTRTLYDLGRFSQVRIAPDLSARAAEVPITIGVTVVGRHELKGGGGLGYEPVTYEARLRGGFSYIPRRFPLFSVGFDGRLALTVDHAFNDYEPKVRAFFNAQRLELFKPFIIGDAGVGLEYFTVESYTAAGPIARAGLSFPIGKRWLTGQLAWNYSRFRFTDPNPVIDVATQGELGLRRKEINGRFEESVTADLRDRPLEPRKGGYISLRVIEGGAFAGGHFDYLEIQPDLRAYLPIRKDSSIAFRVRGGAFLGDVPITQRYYSGGAQNHRGFSARGLSPTIVGLIAAPTPENEFNTEKAETPIGGEAFLETGAELRLSIGELSGLDFGTTIFLDGGDVVDQDTGLDLLNLHWAAGVGIFMKYGGFKIRIDVGQRLNRIGPTDPDYDSTGLLKNTNFFLGVGETY